MTVSDFLARLDPETRSMVERLRAIVNSAAPVLAERIKWNAPSFALGDDDLITLGLERRGGVRLVLHRGAKPKDTVDFRFDDPGRLARWPAPDRGVMVFKDLQAVEATAPALRELCARWVQGVSET
ncbi:DUF1801 domain-containing protein [Caulobacter vibrioides]|uniref:DUF1801 domain-containing protein n=1 Tax=Caulobacter vibrioides TaxID=155892 RepID=A0A290N0S4_CAUVI|nr:DUF1801 domain-containing protein [Caulobacter vibrioides]ATC34281.1 DUF1801 domain-containing protein [Caulobacter vibrioides]